MFDNITTQQQQSLDEETVAWDQVTMGLWIATLIEVILVMLCCQVEASSWVCVHSDDGQATEAASTSRMNVFSIIRYTLNYL